MIIDIKDLVKRYGDLVAVDHLNLQIHKGEIFGLLGPNGCGKSTTINCILALLAYEEGEISVFNEKMTPTAYHLKRHIGVVMQDLAVFDELNVRENIDYFCSLYVADRAERKVLVDEAIAFVELGEYEKFAPAKLSGGLKRRLNIACGIAHKPKLIILDEPTVAVDPQSRNNILEGIVKLNKLGATILYTSHYMEEVEQICHRMAIMNDGNIVAQGNITELKSMIDIGGKITIELLEKNPTVAMQIAKMEFALSVDERDNVIIVSYNTDVNAMLIILEYLRENNIRPNRIYSEMPTLNDVFLAITGKELRDN